MENIFSVLDHVNVWQNLLDVLEKESDNPVDFAFLEAFQFAGIEG